MTDRPTPPGGHKPPVPWRLDELERRQAIDHDRMRLIERIQIIAIGEDGKGGRLQALAEVGETAIRRLADIEKGIIEMQKDAAVARVKIGFLVAAMSAVGGIVASIVTRVLFG